MDEEQIRKRIAELEIEKQKYISLLNQITGMIIAFQETLGEAPKQPAPEKPAPKQDEEKDE